MSTARISLIVGPAKLAILGGGHLVGICTHAESELLLESVALREDIVSYLLGLGRNLGIDLTKACLLLFRKANTFALETVVMLLQHHLLLAGKGTLVGIIDSRYAFIKGLVEGYIGFMVAEHGYGFLDYCIEGVAAVGFGHIVEHALHLAEYAAGEFERHDRVLEGRSLFICHDGIYLRLLLGYAGLDGRDIMGNLDFVEGRYSVRSVPFLEEGVGVTS